MELENQAAVNQGENQAENHGENQVQFIERVGTYPVVASAVDQVSRIYTRCKESNDLLRYSMETAENGAKLITEKAAPVVQNLPISTLNKMALAQLDKLEEKYPIVNKPTEEIMEETKKIYEATVKPNVEKVQAAGQYASEKYTGAKEYATGKIEGAKEMGTSKVQELTKYGTEKVTQLYQAGTERLNTFLVSPRGQVVVQKLDQAISYAETYVEKYLPETDETEKGLKPRTKLLNRTMKEMKNLQLRSTETLQNLHFIVDLIEYARTNIEGAKTKLTQTMNAATEKGQYYWDEIHKEEKDADTTEESKTLERRAIHVARNLSKHLHEGIEMMREVAAPGTLSNTLHEAATFTNNLVWTVMKATNVEELPEFALNKFKDQIFYIQELLLKVGDMISSYSPLNGPIEMDAMNEQRQESNENNANGEHHKAEHKD